MAAPGLAHAHAPPQQIQEQKEASQHNRPTSITRIGQGLASCLQIQELQQLGPRLQSLCLHGNNISRVEGLEGLTALKELNLSSNTITAVTGVHSLSSLTSLNLASNRLSGSLDTLAGLVNLTHLNLSYNGLTSLAGLADLQGPSSKLRALNVKHNLINSLQQLAVLAGCVNLRDLSVSGNPISQLPNYCQAILAVLPYITQLDNLTSTQALSIPFDSHAAQSLAAARLQAYDLPTQRPAASPVHLTTQPHSPYNLSSPSPSQGSPHHTATVIPTHRHTQDPAALTGTHHQAAAPNRMAHQGITQQGQRSAQSTGRQSLSKLTSSRAQEESGGHTLDTFRPDDTGSAKPRLQRVYLRDVAVQAGDMQDRAMKAVQQEAELLKQQLAELTVELESRNQGEEELREQMSSAVHAVEEEAHRRVEEGYREASQAVHKALSELEATRRAAAEAQQRSEAHARREEELRQQVVALEKELGRVQDELSRTRDSCQSEVLRASQSGDAERRRWQETEQQLRDQVHAVEQQLSAARSQAAAGDEKVRSLEAALQQSSSVAMSMTSQIAQTMADSTAQVDVLKAKLATCEQSLCDASRREAEARAQISMLTTNITSLQQRHAQELDQGRQHAAEEVRSQLSRDIAMAEERGRAAAAALAQQERAPLLEQLAFLKAQLQFALKESEKETCGLQEQLGRAHEQLTELQQASQASAAKQREHEALLADLGNVVGQQKLHIQTLQKERDSLQAQLRAAGPEQVKLLAAEVGSLRAAAAEAQFMKEQAEHSRKQWQEVERKLAESQATSIRQVEELNQRVASLESSLMAAKQEAKQQAAAAQALQAKLASTEDAVRVKTAMLDSAHDTISSLKAELSDVAGELDDVRRALEEVEVQAARQAEADAQEKANLRSEIEAGEAALEAMSSSVAGADSKVSAAQVAAQEAAARVKALEGQLADKAELIKYVEEEVERVKGLYEKREVRLREERDAARAAAAAAAMAQEGLEGRVSDQAAKLDLLSAELQAEREACRVATEECTRAQAEITDLKARLQEAENELRGLLSAVERQKASSAIKMRQLATLLSDLA